MNELTSRVLPTEVESFIRGEYNFQDLRDLKIERDELEFLVRTDPELSEKIKQAYFNYKKLLKEQ